MLDKILRITGMGALYFCTGMLLAAVLLGLYLGFAWKIDKGKLNRMASIARGRDILAEEAKLRREIEDRISQMTYDEVLAARVAREMEREFRPDDLGRGADLIHNEGLRIESRLDRMNRLTTAFEQRLQGLREQAESAGMIQMIEMIQNLPADRAKTALLEMVRAGETDRVILVFRGMEPGPRKKILAQFEADEELSELVKILRKIGDGEPEAALAKEFEEQLPEKPENPQP